MHVYERFLSAITCFGSCVSTLTVVNTITVQIMVPVTVKSGCMSGFILRALTSLRINLYL